MIPSSIQVSRRRSMFSLGSWWPVKRLCGAELSQSAGIASRVMGGGSRWP